ncbi:rod shape-determining protein MreC [candidate division WWE3 bacterium RIFOXYC1_FULL_39_7]|uniref:Cell shape-determining protein MreC n=2 Tax=Katanobacteria TaxID=422282 RepID=A0A1F4X7I1_UNCKA|nr:MAG: rod shape-determining protein MreC [candidate division WWE3 bacterium RIFOXYC1_FULL_39_7]OGC77608.1 MAG: rod shape-determining protein MreC [candidate division WWE3 bacterium RIFOXYD1_FULL_39_9]
MKHIGVALIILLFGVLGFLNPVRSLVLALATPVQFGLHTSALSIKDFFTFISGVGSVRTDNLSMRQEIVELNSKLLELTNLKKENELLREQLKLNKISTDDYKLVLAKVMGNPKDLTSGTVILDKGTKYGIKQGDNVILHSNLVGVVSDVTYNRAYVELITSPNMSFTVYNLNSVDKSEALAVGKYGSSISVERILPKERIQVEDMIVTSGKDGIFLPDFVVGKVTGVSEDPAQPLKTASAVTLLDFSKLDRVFVVTTQE